MVKKATHVGSVQQIQLHHVQQQNAQVKGSDKAQEVKATTPQAHQFEVANNKGFSTQAQVTTDTQVPANSTSLFSLQVAEAKGGPLYGDRQDALAAFFETGNVYDENNDPEKVANSFGMCIADATSMIEEKLLSGDHEALGKLLHEARANNEVLLSEGFDGESMEAYFKSTYGYNDAELLSQYWGTSVTQAKSIIGTKLMTGQESTLKGMLSEYRDMSTQTHIDGPGGLGTNNEFNTYAGSVYNYDDASILADYWGTSVSDAKNLIGTKIQHGNKHMINDALAAAHRNASLNANKGYDLKLGKNIDGLGDGAARDAYLKSNYAYEDAEALANHWGSSVSEAKGAIGYKLLSGNEKLLGQLLNEAHGKGMGDWTADQAFYKAGYTYDDASALANHWGTSVSDAKNLIGTKLLNGQSDYVMRSLNEAHGKGMGHLTGTDAFHKSGHSYEDAEALANYWETSISDAKNVIGTKLLNGQFDSLTNLIREANGQPMKGMDDWTDFQAFSKAGYTYNDAVMLSKHWGNSVNEAKNLMGYKLRHGDGDVLHSIYTDLKNQ